MRKYLVFLTVVIFFSCTEYKGEKDSLSYDEIEIIFDGYGDYDTEGKLTIPITDSTEINTLNRLKNISKPHFFSNKGRDYIIRLYFSDSKTGNKLLMTITKSNDWPINIEYGSGTIFDGNYKNDELVNYISSLIKLDAIKRYKGSLSQEEYDTFN